MARKTRIKNEEIWQQVREEIIHVLLNNEEITDKNDIVEYFKKHYTEYHMELADVEIIIKDSRYINQLLEKNKNEKNEFVNRLKAKFAKIIEDETTALENNSDADELDKEVVKALLVLFDKVLDENDLMNALINANKS